MSRFQNVFVCTALLFISCRESHDHSELREVTSRAEQWQQPAGSVIIKPLKSAIRDCSKPASLISTANHTRYLGCEASSTTRGVVIKALRPSQKSAYSNLQALDTLRTQICNRGMEIQDFDFFCFENPKAQGTSGGEAQVTSVDQMRAIKPTPYMPQCIPPQSSSACQQAVNLKAELGCEAVSLSGDLTFERYDMGNNCLAQRDLESQICSFGRQPSEFKIKCYAPF